jgi:uncharacterized protein (DUF433 family)
MPKRVKRVTMYKSDAFAPQAPVLQRLRDRDLVSIRANGAISVFPVAAQEDLDAEEREVIYRLLRYTVPDPDKPLIIKRPGLVGGRAALAGTRTPVWQVVNGRRLGASDYDLRRHYGVSDEALRHVFAYHEAHREEIEGDIFDNEQIPAAPRV